MAGAHEALGATVSPATAPSARGAGAKRAADLAGSLILLLLASPVLLIVSLLVKRSSPGPAFFRQVRLGRNGERFLLLKFRTMCVDGEARLERDRDLFARYAAGGHKIPDGEDPRIIPLGRFLRRTGIDELPQLVNVLRGEMSLVGPRPILPVELPRYPAFVELMRGIRPGMTGAWQVSREHPADYDRRAEIDREYVTKRSMVTDALILLHTLVRALR
jgi:lipopolysaccharide/colanic/teichoic acid biosynthesis glycosyltransferase